MIRTCDLRLRRAYFIDLLVKKYKWVRFGYQSGPNEKSYVAEETLARSRVYYMVDK